MPDGYEEWVCEDGGACICVPEETYPRLRCQSRVCSDASACIRQVDPTIRADRSKFCPPDRWLCDDDSACVTSGHINDGHAVCDDGSDEEFSADEEKHMRGLEDVAGSKFYVAEGRVYNFSMPYNGLCWDGILKPCGSR